MGMGSASDCLLGQCERIMWISGSEAGLKVKKSEGGVEGNNRCGDDVALLPARDRRSLDIFISEERIKAVSE